MQVEVRKDVSSHWGTWIFAQQSSVPILCWGAKDHVPCWGAKDHVPCPAPKGDEISFRVQVGIPSRSLFER